MANELNECWLWKKGWRINERNEWYKPAYTNSSPPATECKRDTGHEPAAKDARETNHAGFRLVRITSYRVHLCDERNLFDKYFTDSLVKAGLLFDDSPEWCKIEVVQRKCSRPEYECTEIEIIETGSGPQP